MCSVCEDLYFPTIKALKDHRAAVHNVDRVMEDDGSSDEEEIGDMDCTENEEEDTEIPIRSIFEIMKNPFTEA